MAAPEEIQALRKALEKVWLTVEQIDARLRTLEMLEPDAAVSLPQQGVAMEAQEAVEEEAVSETSAAEAAAPAATVSTGVHAPGPPPHARCAGSHSRY